MYVNVSNAFHKEIIMLINMLLYFLLFSFSISSYIDMFLAHMSRTFLKSNFFNTVEAKVIILI